MSTSEKAKFKEYCIASVIAMLGKFEEWSPSKHNFTRSLSCFNPRIIIQYIEKTKKRKSDLLTYLVDKNIMKGCLADIASSQFSRWCSLVESNQREEFKKFSTAHNCLDMFFLILLKQDLQYKGIVWYS